MLTIAGKLAEVTLFYLITVFLLSYATRTSIAPKSQVLGAIVIGAAIQLGTIPLFGWLGDRVGQRLLHGLGGVLLAVLAIPAMAVIVERSTIGLRVAIIAGLGLNYPLMFVPQASLYSAQFPPNCDTGGLISVGAYLATLGFLATFCAWLMRASSAMVIT